MAASKETKKQQGDDGEIQRPHEISAFMARNRSQRETIRKHHGTGCAEMAGIIAGRRAGRENRAGIHKGRRGAVSSRNP